MLFHEPKSTGCASNSLTSFSHGVGGMAIQPAKALSNYLVLPLVKLLGIGLGSLDQLGLCVFREVCPAVGDYDSTVRANALRFSLYHFVNLMVGYVVGRRGYFNMEKLKGNLLICAPRWADVIAAKSIPRLPFEIFCNPFDNKRITSEETQ